MVASDAYNRMEIKNTFLFGAPLSLSRAKDRMHHDEKKVNVEQCCTAIIRANQPFKVARDWTKIILVVTSRE
jgi:hypothetical protein